MFCLVDPNVFATIQKQPAWGVTIDCLLARVVLGNILCYLCSLIIVLCSLQAHDLVQVECYLPSEGALVHYWYHVSSLQRPPPGYRKSPAMKGAEVASSPHVHRYAD